MGNKLTITKPEEVERRMQDIYGCPDFTLSDIDYSNVLYITPTCQSSRTAFGKAIYAWIDTGRTYQGHKLFISLYRPTLTDDFEGFYVGTAKPLISQTELYKAPADNKERLISKCKSHVTAIYSREPVNTDLAESVRDTLLLDNWATLDGLDRYIKVIGDKLHCLVQRNIGAGKYYILNSVKDAVVNTGLLNSYGVPVYILYKNNSARDSYQATLIVDSTSTMIRCGFAVEDDRTRLLAIDFRVGFTVEPMTLANCDVTMRGLDHITGVRGTRLPDDVTPSSVYMSINKAVGLWACDPFYARISYNAQEHNLSWYLPLHINIPLTEKPNLIAVFTYSPDIKLYSLRTVLPCDDVIRDRVLVMNLYTPCNW